MFILFTLLYICQAQFIFPNINTTLYSDNIYNISWDQIQNQNDLHIFLTNYIDNINTNISISNYDNGSLIIHKMTTKMVYSMN